MRRTFVVGCPRSGTTIVQAMLARHPAVFTLPETGFFTHLHGNTEWRWGDAHAKYRRARWRQRLGFSRKHERNLFMTLQRMLSSTPASSLRPSLRIRTLERRFVTLLDRLALENERELWLEKTPNHLLFIPEIEALVPDARFIHVIRPGMDVLASLADASLLFENDNAFDGGTVHWARRWNRAMQIHRTHMAQPQHHLLFLDDLVERPEREWQRLCGFLDIAADEPLNDACTQLIADLEQEPWKRRAIHGHLRVPDSKVDGLFGPKLQRWLQTRLASYNDLRAHHLQAQGEHASALREQLPHAQRARTIMAKSAGR